MEKRFKRNINVNNVMSAHTTSGKTLKLEIDPVEINNQSVNIEMKDCAIRVQPVKLQLKGDNLRLPKEEIKIGHVEMSLEMGGLEMSKDATRAVECLWSSVAKYLGGFLSESEIENEKDQEDVEESEKTDDDFDPIEE